MPMRYVEALGISSLWVVAMFHFFPALTMLPIIVHRPDTVKGDWVKASVAGILVGSGFVFYALGLIIASVTKTVVLFYMTPIWSTILAYFIINERVGLGRCFAIIGALVGCALVMNLNALEMRFEPTDLLGLLSGLFWALGSVRIRQYTDVNFIQVTFLQYFFGGFMAVAAAFYFGSATPDLNVFFSAVPITLLTSAFIFMPTALLVFRIMQYVSPGLVGILMLSEALIAALSAAIWLGETLVLSQWLGVLVILATGVLIGLHEGNHKSRQVD